MRKSKSGAPVVHYVARDVDAFTVETACKARVDVSQSVTLVEETTCLGCRAMLARRAVG